MIHPAVLAFIFFALILLVHNYSSTHSNNTTGGSSYYGCNDDRYDIDDYWDDDC